MAPAAVSDERAVIAAAVGGDRDAYRTLYDAHAPAVAGFLARRVAPSDVDDLAAETFARAFTRLDQFTWQGVSIRAWLLRIAFHQIVARSRRRSSTEVVTADDLTLGVAHPGHEDVVVSRLTDQPRVAAALATLTPEQRAAVELRYIDGLSAAEVALILDTTDEAVRALAHRALRRLRAALGSSDGVGEKFDGTDPDD